MIIKTKKYKLEKETYIKTALVAVLKQQWWVFLIALAICTGYLWIPNIWWIIGAAIALVLYVLFWLIQFAGFTNIEQGKMFFDRLSYEINSQQVLIKINTKQGMPVKWEQIKRVAIGKDHFVLFFSKVQLIYLPFKIFNTENERKFLTAILKRKGYIADKENS